MKLLVVISVCMRIFQSSAVSTEVKMKMLSKQNALPAPQKNEFYFPQSNQQTTSDYVPVQVMQKPLFVAQQPQPAMLIIAQPTYVPQNVLYGGNNVAVQQQQQLLNYFHSNPQAKYQFLYGGYQQQPSVQPYIPQQHAMGAPTVAAYQVVPNPVFNNVNHLMTVPAQLSFNQAPVQHNQVEGQYVQPMQLSHIAQLAQMTAQRFTAPIRSFPPIITGFENFTPEQQAQIKAQLGAHLGTPLSTASTVPSTTTQYSQQIATQPAQNLNTNELMQNQDKNSAQSSSSGFSPSLAYRAQYTKG